jgi:hypothetical protein
MKILLALLLLTGSLPAQVTSGRILNANREPQNWPTYDGYLIAIDAKNGRALWNKTVFDWQIGLRFNVAALIIKNVSSSCCADLESRPLLPCTYPGGVSRCY